MASGFVFAVAARTRIHKSELSIRPILASRENRLLAHIMVCFLVYAMWKTLEQWQILPASATARGHPLASSMPSVRPP
jgi:hypothetical protein